MNETREREEEVEDEVREIVQRADEREGVSKGDQSMTKTYTTTPAAGRFQVLAGDVSGAAWTIATSDNPAVAFAEYDALQAQGRRYRDQNYTHLVVWDDQRDRQVSDLDEALETLEEEK